MRNQYEIGTQTLNSASGTLDCQISLWSADQVMFLLSLPELHLLIQNCTPSSLWQNRAWLSTSALYRRGLVSIAGLRFREERRCPGYCVSHSWGEEGALNSKHSKSGVTTETSQRGALQRCGQHYSYQQGAASRNQRLGSSRKEGQEKGALTRT